MRRLAQPAPMTMAAAGMLSARPHSTTSKVLVIAAGQIVSVDRVSRPAEDAWNRKTRTSADDDARNGECA